MTCAPISAYFLASANPIPTISLKAVRFTRSSSQEENLFVRSRHCNNNEIIMKLGCQLLIYICRKSGDKVIDPRYYRSIFEWGKLMRGNPRFAAPDRLSYLHVIQALTGTP